MMNPNIRTLIAFFSVAVILIDGGCASPASLPRDGMTTIAPSHDKMVTVYLFNRNWSILGQPSSSLHVDDRRIGLIGSHEYTWFHLSPGIHEISTNYLSLGGYKSASRTMSFERGHIYYLEDLAFGATSLRTRDRATFGPVLVGHETAESLWMAEMSMHMITAEEAAQLMNAYKLVGNTIR